MILLVRHGETELNAARVLQPPDTPLSARGIAQAERLARRLARQPIAAILSSDLARARMTADRVAAATGARVSLDAKLQERNFGDLRGRPYAELDEDPFAPGYVPPGGESWEDLHARVDAAWELVLASVREARSGDLVVVTHGLVCHSLVRRRLSVAPLPLPAGFANTSLTVIDPEPPWRVSRVNCTEHLDAATDEDLRA